MTVEELLEILRSAYEKGTIYVKTRKGNKIVTGIDIEFGSGDIYLKIADDDPDNFDFQDKHH